MAVGPRVACLVAAFLGCALGGPVGAPGARRPRPALLRLRGGQEQAVLDELLRLRGGQEALLDNEGEEAELPAPAASAAARARANIRAGKLPTPAAKPRVVKRKRRGGFGLRDAGTAALCVSAAGFFALGLNHDLYMRALPPSAQGLVWLAIGGALPAGLFALVALLNAERAKLISKLLFGDETSTKVAPALVYALGALASFQGLPQAAG